MAAADKTDSILRTDPIARVWTLDELHKFVRMVCDAFFHADLFTAVCEFINCAHGSFGVQAISASEHHTTVIASRGQSMCLALDPEAGLALYASDSSAIQVPAVERAHVHSSEDDDTGGVSGHASHARRGHDSQGQGQGHARYVMNL
eukprot:CAMPEP_0205933666 /NCGR_PEP_ID=MMETSP1325-20131115/33867_1 /ASSEMBLY_ACC=CAM_ASM_000708 /TAXON_ID=236786 /ORGANISM="Florenciella sp., Strain RCC1007" /LENGTH=146 /DNA_ID=CAMNT_0053303553 /DNA_START=38 /DNA_END=475 /DNA_ORIENTATION=+